MEDSPVTEETMRIFFETRERYEKVGIVLQAYLRRSAEDARRIAAVGGNVRVCKGIYVEPPSIAFQDREEIRRSYIALVELLLSAGSYVGIATHDPMLVERSLAVVGRLACRSRPTSSRCCSASRGRCAGAWLPKGSACGSTCRTATPGTPIPSAGSRKTRRLPATWSKACSFGN